jgi:CRISPR/Cas system-associated protein Cas10 (large subunit of type III CRISPR-Cas system)
VVVVSEQVIVQTTAAETRKERKMRERTEKEVRKQEELEAKLARYAQLRANVRRRRGWYVVFILLAIAVFVATVWDIVYNDSDLKWFLLPAYVVLFILGLILLLSRKRHLEEVNEIKVLERAWMECDTCRTVFQFGSESFLSRRRVGFTCPVCGDESALPLPGAEPVERPLPAGRLEEINYLCGNCKEDIVIGVYGGRPRDVDFRACPKCGVTGQIKINTNRDQTIKSV